MKLQIKLDLANACTDQNPQEVARILRSAANAIERGAISVEYPDEMGLMEANGNTIGKVKVTK